MLKVVIIDANSITRNLLSTLLIAGGHDVVGTSNTSDANLARAIKLAPQVLCVDIGEASDQNFGIIDMLREALPKALIFLVSGNMDSALVQGGAQRGLHGFIVKPFNPLTVQTVIRNAILKIARQLQTRPVPATETSASTDTSADLLPGTTSTDTTT
ncbi:MAG: two-component system chemotaxis response regulator CheY [Bradyrhizobium sp.]|jgi:two-component system chemotaxis response regulator CheY